MKDPIRQFEAVLREYLIASATALCESIGLSCVGDGWPEGGYVLSEEPVWSICVPSSQCGVGPDRYIVVSKLTGRVLADERIGE